MLCAARCGQFLAEERPVHLSRSQPSEAIRNVNDYAGWIYFLSVCFAKTFLVGLDCQRNCRGRRADDFSMLRKYRPDQEAETCTVSAIDSPGPQLPRLR